MTTVTLRLLAPEIVLIAAAVAIYLGGTFSTSQRTWRWIAGGAVLLAAAALWCQHGPVGTGPFFGEKTFSANVGLAENTDLSPSLLQFDSLAWFARWLALVFGALLGLLASRPHADDTPEYVGSLLLTVAGLMLVTVAADLVLLFVALELISIPTYVLLYLGRRDAAHQESAAKYFFLSVLASAILLYGFSFLYGLAGSTELAAVRAALDGAKASSAGLPAFAKLAMVLVFAGLCFKITAVPFHFYAPDVYEGTTHPNAALLSVVPKAAGLVAMVRILVLAMPGVASHLWPAVLVISVLTMTVGNVMALWQNDLRRLLAYSAVAHAGYMLIALAVGLAADGASNQWNGIGALWFYLAAYAVATIGAFATLEHLGRPDCRLDAVDELAGLGRTRPAAAAILAVTVFSLAGVPPLAGFWGKLLVFGGALNMGAPADAAGSVRWWFVGAAILGVLNAAVAAAYYLRIVAVMYFRTPLATPRAQGGAGAWWAAVTCALLVIGIGLYPGPLIREADRATGQQPISSRSDATACCQPSGK